VPTTDSRDLGLLALRLGVGATLVAHGTQKLFGWFGGHGLAGTAGFFESIGFTPGRANAMLAGAGEAGGGSLLALGLATPAAGAAVAGTMAVAASMHKDNGFFAQDGGLEYPAVLALTAGAIALSGPGRLSLDAAFGHRANRHWMRAVGLASVPVAVALVTRRRRTALAVIAAGTSPTSSTETTSSELPLQTNPTG
jgi:putative oxidoreductase